MNDHLDRLVLTLAGREVRGGWDRIRRYCGLEWSGGPPETWAFRFYDAMPSTDDALEPVDVTIAAALHPGLARADLGFFWDHREALTTWIAGLPDALALRDADDGVIDRLIGLRDWSEGTNFALLTKALHRKRPELIPLVDREVLDWYRPLTGERGAVAAWPALIRAIRDDLFQNSMPLALMNTALEQQIGRRASHLRLLDIVIWMGGTR